MILNAFASGFTPDAEILLIGVKGHTGEFKFFKKAEEFLEYFLGTDDKIVVGFNILKFDIPLLLLKAKGSHRFGEFFKKINYSNIVDLFTILTFHNRGIIKGLDFHLERHGIEKGFLSDIEIVRKLEKNENSEGEVRKKLEAVSSLYWKMKEKVGLYY